MKCLRITKIIFLFSLYVFSCHAFASISPETCKELDTFLYGRYASDPQNGPLNALGISDIAAVTVADKDEIFRKFHECYAAYNDGYKSTTQQLKIPHDKAIEWFDRDKLNELWKRLLEAAEVARTLSDFDSQYLSLHENATMLLSQITGATITDEQNTTLAGLKLSASNLTKQCTMLFSKNTAAGRCFDQMRQVDNILGNGINEKIASEKSKIEQEKRDADQAIAALAEQKAAAVAHAQEQQLKLQRDEQAALKRSRQELEDKLWYIVWMIVLLSTVISVGMALTGRIIFYNDYDDLQGSLAAIALPLLLFFVMFFLSLPGWFNIILVIGCFLGLFVTLGHRTYLANKKNIGITLMLVVAKMFLSILYLLHLWVAFTDKSSSGRRQGWLVLAVLTPLLIKLVHTRSGAFNYNEQPAAHQDE